MGGILTSDDARPRANERLMRAGRDCGNSLLEPYLLQACAGDWQARSGGALLWAGALPCA
jgi:hypothetical protein